MNLHLLDCFKTAKIQMRVIFHIYELDVVLL